MQKTFIRELDNVSVAFMFVSDTAGPSTSERSTFSERSDCWTQCTLYNILAAASVRKVRNLSHLIAAESHTLSLAQSIGNRPGSHCDGEGPRSPWLKEG